MTKYLLLLFFLASCGSNGSGSRSSIDGANVHPEFQPYVAKFVEHMNSSGHPLTRLSNLQMHFTGNLSSQVLGYCEQETFYEDKKVVKVESRIYINETAWYRETFNLQDKEQLTFHELGHCLLDREHLNTKIDALIANIVKPVPKSIMAERHYDVRSYYQQDGNKNSYNYGSYIQELFNYPLPLSGYTFDPTPYEYPVQANMDFLTYEEPLHDEGKDVSPGSSSHVH